MKVFTTALTTVSKVMRFPRFHFCFWRSYDTLKNMDDATADLTRFLRVSKLATYAGQGGSIVQPALPDSKQLEYRDGDFFYRDVYVGSIRFVGQEIAYLSDRAIWSMSYAGGLCKDVPTNSAKPVYTFLRQALLNTPPELPLRGPSRWEADGMLYTCITDGSLEWFNGREVITRDGSVLYELFFSGGCLA